VSVAFFLNYFTLTIQGAK